jgi:hypothetical protein
MAEFNVRSDSVNVEQIMEQIRARIREKRGVDYTEQQIRELASVKLEKLIDPRVRSDLVEQFKRRRPAVYEPLMLPALKPFEPRIDAKSLYVPEYMPEYSPSHVPDEWLYAFEQETIYETHRGPLRFIRKLLNPILKLLFNPNPIIQALHRQGNFNRVLVERDTQIMQRDRLIVERDKQIVALTEQILARDREIVDHDDMIRHRDQLIVERDNTRELQRVERREMDALYYEVIHNLVFELTRLGIENKNLKMRLESIASRLEFNERRARALESVVVYKPSEEVDAAKEAGAGSQRAAAERQQGESAHSQQPHTVATGPGAPAGPGAPPLGEGPGQRSRRRRRRRGRRGGASALSIMGGGSSPSSGTGSQEQSPLPTDSAAPPNDAASRGDAGTDSSSADDDESDQQ